MQWIIAGAMLVVTGAISIAALVLQMLGYDPPCAPLVSASLAGPCGVFRLLVLLMLPITLAGCGLLAAGVVLRWRDRRR